MADTINIDGMKIPEHVAIILDGNGRWAKKRHMPRNYGHAQGSRAVEQICEDAWNLGIKHLTVYAFSTENWKRPESEVNALMKLLRTYLKDCLKRAGKNNMRVRVLGEVSRLDQDIQDTIQTLEEATKNNTGLCFQVALNYGSRDEIMRAFGRVMDDIESGKCTRDQISEETFGKYLDTGKEPDPDLLIRTSGEQRLSNFMLWQLAYTEFYFTDTLWPDFDKEELKKAIVWYNGRERRYGGV
jgi:undecaprenyl diphosphate synthase